LRAKLAAHLDKKKDCVRQPSHELFNAWASKHKEVIHLEDRLAGPHPDCGSRRALARELEHARSEARSLQAAALNRFREELRERGLQP
jgi:hypothetical protein